MVTAGSVLGSELVVVSQNST